MNAHPTPGTLTPSPYAWSVELANQHPQMDATHQEFIDHLARLHAALDGERSALLDAFDDMVLHTVAHFGQEDRWMLDTGYTPENCHTLQHRQVLDLFRDLRRQIVEQDRWELIGRLLPELSDWFSQHAQGADAALAFHISTVGYDTVTRRMPERAGQNGEAAAVTAPASSCGSDSCKD